MWVSLIKLTINIASSLAASPHERRGFFLLLSSRVAPRLDVLQALTNEDDRSLAYIAQKAIDAYAEEHGPRPKSR